jgi:TPR repeat protein
MGYKMILFRMIYEEGLDDVKKNYERAFEYYYEACNRNVAEGFKKLSIMYRYVKE